MVNNKEIRKALYLRLNREPLTTNPGYLATTDGSSIHHSVAPQEARYPLLVFFKTSAIQVGVFASANNPHGEAYRDHIWTVKGVARGTRSGEAEDIDHAAYELLQYGEEIPKPPSPPTTMEIAGADIMLITRIGDIEYTEVVGDTQYRHCGGNYRLVIQDA